MCLAVYVAIPFPPSFWAQEDAVFDKEGPLCVWKEITGIKFLTRGVTRRGKRTAKEFLYSGVSGQFDKKISGSKTTTHLLSQAQKSGKSLPTVIIGLFASKINKNTLPVVLHFLRNYAKYTLLSPRDLCPS